MSIGRVGKVPRQAFTLIEMIVAIAVIGILATIAAAGMRGEALRKKPDAGAIVLKAARTRAITEGRTITVQVSLNGKAHLVTALPDGGVIGGPAIGADRLNGDSL